MQLALSLFRHCRNCNWIITEKKVISKFNNKIDKANARFDNVNQYVDTNSFF